MNWPKPSEKYPMEWFPQVGYLKNFITKENIIIWDYTYYDDLDWVEHFENKNILYHFPFIWDKLIIWKFCAIATWVKFIMNWANHKMSWFSIYPFWIFWKWWEKAIPKMSDLPYKWDTFVWNDVWIWYESKIMPWVKIWNGSIIWAFSVVTKDVPAYTIVWWNPAKIIRKRFADETIEKLENLAWWNWDAEKITKNLEYIVWNDLEKLI